MAGKAKRPTFSQYWNSLEKTGALDALGERELMEELYDNLGESEHREDRLIEEIDRLKAELAQIRNLAKP